jgi:hypothetical protein
MAAFAFLVALAALVIAIMAFRKAGGSAEDLQRQVGSIRQKTAEILFKVQNSVRGEGKKEG